MADTTQEKNDIRLVIREISKRHKTILKERSVIENYPNGLKINGMSEDKEFGVMVCTNKLSDGKIKAGQRTAILKNVID